MRPIGRRPLLKASAAAVTAAALPACTDPGSAPLGAASASVAPPSGLGVTLRWLGNSAWEIRFGTTTLLIDPWLTRFPTGTYTKEGIRPDTPLVSDPANIDPYVTRADVILVSHGHYDHITDVPYLARRTGARVLGTDSHLAVLRALDTPERQLTAVTSGQRLDFDGSTVQVFQSLHSMSGTPPRVPFPGSRTGTGNRPRTVADLVEGGTLAYQITVDGRFRMVLLGSGNLDEQALAGLRPDLVVMAAGGAPDYPARVMRTLGNPRWVLPAHWDDYDLPLSAPARDWGGLHRLADAVRAAHPAVTFVPLEHLQQFTP